MKRPMFMFAAETAAPAAGSTGSSAVTTTISPAGDAGGIDPMSYEPPAPADLDAFIRGDAKEGDAGPLGKEGKPADPPAKKEEKPPEGKKEPDPKTDDNAPASQLRARLKQYEEEKAKLLADLETAKSDKRVAELEEKLAAKEKAIAEKEKGLADAERKLTAANPALAKKVQSIADAFNNDFKKYAEAVPAMVPDYLSLVDEFQALPRGTADFAPKLKEFRERLREKYEHDATEVFDAVRKGLEFRGVYSKAMEDVQRDAQGMLFEEEKRDWERKHKEVDEKWDEWFKPPADAAATDPYNHNLFLQRFEEQMDKAEVSRVNGNLKAYIDRIFNGVQPRTKTDFPGMDDAAIEKEMQTIGSRYAAEREDAKRIMAVGVKLLTYFRPIIAEHQKLRDRLKEKEGAAPPDPTRKDGTKPAGAGATDSELDEIKMPTPEEIAAEVGRG